MKKYDISAIVPLYKGNKYVIHLMKLFKNNIQYARKNGLDIHLEVIMINDYPSEKIDIHDDSYDFQIVYLINEKNLGIHETRVRGVHKAQGEFIFMFDQDDEITEDFLYSQFLIINKDKRTPMVISNGIIQHPSYERRIYESGIMHFFSQYGWFYALLDNRIVSPGQCLIRKDAIPSFWLMNSMKHNGADDLLLWLLIFGNQKYGRPLLNKQCLYTHVNTNNNTSLDISGMYASVDEMIELLINNRLCSTHMINLIGYRNDYQKGIESGFKIPFIEKWLVKLIYCLRKRKNES